VECVSASVNPSGSIEVGSTYTITCNGNNETSFDLTIKRNGSTLGTYAMSPSGNQWTYSYNPSQAGNYQFICIAKNPSASPSTDTCNTISRTVTAQTFC
jgi:hypothetical protein